MEQTVAARKNQFRENSTVRIKPGLTIDRAPSLSFPTPENSCCKISFRYMFMFLSFLPPSCNAVNSPTRSEPTKEAYKFLDEIDRACKNSPDSYAFLSLSLSFRDVFAPPFVVSRESKLGTEASLVSHTCVWVQGGNVCIKEGNTHVNDSGCYGWNSMA